MDINILVLKCSFTGIYSMKIYNLVMFKLICCREKLHKLTVKQKILTKKKSRATKKNKNRLLYEEKNQIPHA